METTPTTHAQPQETITTASAPALASVSPLPLQEKRPALDLQEDPPADQPTHTSTTKRSKRPSILTIIETVQRLQYAYRPITAQEREIIQSWAGWGPYAPAFEPNPKEQWQAVGPQIRLLLGPEGYEEASAATPTSYFTTPFISQAIWQLAEQLGFAGGNVLEPGCGTGQILSQAPSSLELNITGIEQEPFTASVAQLLFPQAHLINAPIQEVALANESFDLVVGNVPFADVPIYDRTLPFKHKLSLHNYCIYRSLQALRPGGLALLVTTHYTMDALDAKARLEIARLGLLLGAIRLPSHGHQWANTAVITDILVLQRRSAHACWEGHEWMESSKQTIQGVEGVETNTYYAAHPEQILGSVSLGRGMYRDHELLIKAPEDLEDALERAVQRIVQQAAQQKSTYIPRIDRTQLDPHLVALREDGLREGCFYRFDGVGLVEIINGQPKVVTKLVAELTALVQIRDAALALMEAESDFSQTDEELTPLRDALNQRYDAYVKQFGDLRRSTLLKRIDKETGEEHLSRRLPPAMYAFKNDEHYPLVLSLEIYDDETQSAQKAAIFTQRVNRPAVYKETADSPEEAIALSLDRFGTVDFSFIAQATGRAEQEVAAYLGDLVYEDPATGTWEIAPLYLSGNVRKKLDIARLARQSDAKWQRNVEALERVQPEPIAPEDIKVLLGAPWIPVEDIMQFCDELLGMRPAIKRDPVSGTWDVAPPLGTKSSPTATSTWGTSRMSAFKLLEHLLNHKTTTVEDEDEEGKRHLNTEETMLAQQKKRELQARFSEWIWQDNERTKRLATLYNTLYNGVVPTIFSGAHLSFPGMDPYWQEHLYPWQRDFIARMINRRSALCAYPVGAGKTKIQVAGAMTLRRMGLISKAAIVVPNHLIEQITAEAKQLYPAATILMISREDLAREKRRLFMARIATGNHDLVIMTHSAFEAIDVHPATKRAYMQERIREYKQVLLSIDPKSEDRADKRNIKRIEKLLQRLREQLKELLDVPHDTGITFEQLSISYLVVDEFHFYKNLGLPTNQEKLTVTPSQRAQDMLMKMRWLEKHHGKRPFASTFTATPISNSMVEALVMLWYLHRDRLEEYEIAGVDDFASLYIESEEKIEVTPNGAGFRMYERPSKFINLPEFLHLFTSVADIRSPDMLADKRPDRLEHTVAVEPTEEVIAYVNGLVERSEKLQQGCPMVINGKEDNMLWVTGDGRKAALWLGLHGMPEAYPAKLDAIATAMAKIYHRWQEQASYLPGPHKSFQIGFCDQGTPSKEKGDQAYGELKQLLVQKGIPAQGIRFIHEAQTDAAKAVLFEQCRSGEVAILLGSTGKLGTGTNIQTRCAAIHHGDAPWRPDEVEQREGRGQRPGNLYPVVEIFYYVQRRTFDAYSWQILANKAKFFNQIRSATVISREISYSDDSSLTYGQVKAAATGDVLLLEHANVSLSADAYSRLHASFKRARERDKQEAQFLRDQAHAIERQLKRYQQIAETVASYDQEHPFLTPDRLLLTTKETRRDFISNEVIQTIKHNATAQRKLGYWQGVPIFLKVDVRSTEPYILTVNDPSTGIDLACHPQWFEQDHLWRFAWKIEQFFQTLAGTVEERTAEITHLLNKAQEFEAQAHTVFPQYDAWQAAVKRKQALDDYIDFAAKAHSEEDLHKLAQLRQTLLATASSDLTERPKPKNTATCMLPPRHPYAATGANEAPQEEMTSTRMVVVEESASEPTIEEVVRTIKQHVVGSKATVTFGQVEALNGSPKKKKTRKGGAKTKAQPLTLWECIEDQLALSTPTIVPNVQPDAQQQLTLW